MKISTLFLVELVIALAGALLLTLQPADALVGSDQESAQGLADPNGVSPGLTSGAHCWSMRNLILASSGHCA